MVLTFSLSFILAVLIAKSSYKVVLCSLGNINSLLLCSAKFVGHCSWGSFCFVA